MKKTKEIEALTREVGKSIKTEQELTAFRQMLTKATVEAALTAELDEHLGYDRHERAGSDNQRNGHTRKTVQTEDGQFELDTPVTEKVALSLSWYGNGKPVLPPWMTRS